MELPHLAKCLPNLWLTRRTRPGVSLRAPDRRATGALARKNNGMRKQFFSEEKHQKTFALEEIPVVLAMTSTLPQVQS
jgi:hypothetical protein